MIRRFIFEEREIIHSKHAVERFYDDERFNADEIGTKLDFSNKVNWVINNAIKEINRKYFGEPGYYGVHSKSTGIGLVIYWGRYYDKFDDGKNHAIIITMLPIKKYHNFKGDDTVLIVEDIMRTIYRQKNESIRESEGSVDMIHENGMDIVFFEGKYHDSNVPVIFVE